MERAAVAFQKQIATDVRAESVDLEVAWGLPRRAERATMEGRVLPWRWEPPWRAEGHRGERGRCCCCKRRGGRGGLSRRHGDRGHRRRPSQDEGRRGACSWPGTWPRMSEVAAAAAAGRPGTWPRTSWRDGEGRRGPGCRRGVESCVGAAAAAARVLTSGSTFWGSPK